MTGQQLKNSILQMAVQGKLVPQDPNDEPASVLLERIRKEKEQLVKDGKIKKEKKPSYIFRGADNLPYEKVGKNEPVCIADEVPFEIPDSWEWVRFGTVMLNRDAERIPLSVNERSKLQKIYDYYGASGIIDKVDRYLFSKPLLLIGEDGANLLLRSKPIAFIAQGQYWVNNHAHVLDAIGGLQLEYIATYINAINLSPYVTGTAQPKMNQEKMNSILVPVPPVEEQKNIIKKLNLILPLVNDYGIKEKELTQYNSMISELLKKSILQEAVQGKLVLQDPLDEPASVLLDRIRAEKERMIQEGKIKRDKHESVIYRRDNSHYEKLDGIERCIDDEIPFEIPESWIWIRLGSLFTINPRNNISDDTVVGFMPMPLLKEGFSDSHTYEKKMWKDVKSGFTHFANNDVVIAKITPCFQNRKSAVIHDLPSGYGAGTTELHVLRDYTKILYMPYFLMICKTHAFIQNGMKNFSGTAGQQRVGKDFISNYLVPLPPINEQKRIVKKVNVVINSCNIL